MSTDHELYYDAEGNPILLTVDQITGDPLVLRIADFIDQDAPEQGGPVLPTGVATSKPAVVKPNQLTRPQRSQLNRQGNAPAIRTVVPPQRINPAITAQAAAAAARRRALTTAIGGINPTDRIRFIDVFPGCGRLLSSPAIPPVADFQAAERLFAFQQLFLRYPYPVFSKSASETSGTATINTDSADIVAGTTSLLYPYVIVTIGASALQGVVASIATVSFSGLTQDGIAFTTGTLTFEFTDLTKGIKFALTPWVLVSGTPRPVVGKLSAVDTETSLVVANLPTGARATIVFPGTNHESVRALVAGMRD